MQKALDIKFHSKEHMFVMHVLKTGWGKGKEKKKKELEFLLIISGSFQSTDIAGYCKEREQSLLTKMGKKRHREVQGMAENFHSH